MSYCLASRNVSDKGHMQTTYPLRPRPPPLPLASAPLPDVLATSSHTGGASGRSFSKLSARKFPASSITCRENPDMGT